MRVVRTVAGLVLLTIGLPVLLVGGALWTLMQHRDAGGAFSGSLEQVSTAGRAIVVPDVDTLLREDAAFVRAGDTRMRLTVPGETFLGLAPAAEVRAYLAGAAYSRVDAVTVARGDLPVRIAPVDAQGLAGPAASDVAPGSQSFWTRQGSGTLEWTADEVDGREVSLVIMRVDATPGLTVDVRASATPGWLVPATWTLVALGALLLASGIVALAWPVRSREVVFVVDPSQVPEVSARLSGLEGPAGPPPVWPALPAAEVSEPLPVLAGDEPRPADGSWPEWPSDSTPGRPATLADALAGAGKTVPPPPGPAWPPAQPGPSAWSPDADGAQVPAPPNAWRRAEAARLAGLPAVTAAAAQLSVESVPTSGAPAGAATAIPTTRSTQAENESGPRTPAPRAEADADQDGSPTPGVAHLRSVKTDGTERPAGKRGSRTATKKRPVVFVDTAVEPTGESPDRPVVATRTRTKSAPQPRDAASPQTTTTQAPTPASNDTEQPGIADLAEQRATIAEPATEEAKEPATADVAEPQATIAEPASDDAERSAMADMVERRRTTARSATDEAERSGIADVVERRVTTAGAATDTERPRMADVVEPQAFSAGDAQVSGDVLAGLELPATAAEPAVAKPAKRKPRRTAATAGTAPALLTEAEVAGGATAAPKAAKPTRAKKRVADAGAEPTTVGTEVIESTGSDADQTDAEHGAASAGAPVGTGALVGTTGDPAPDAAAAAKPARRTTRTKKAADTEATAQPAKATRTPSRKTEAAVEVPVAEAKPEPAATGTPFGGMIGTTAPAKARRRKTAAGLPAPETTDAGPAHTAVAALAAKRPTTTRRRPNTRPTDQAS
ncbi:hypothetical protein SAMN05421684_1628 [Asanoa ishikariensis]|uniref:Uncharacterized protein n=1 Tax=Asanoa ishikariensis TaxID=137265 RepID=A0A1H3MV28_9ACTN|nr:hypothetical protein [Asanoa ishikariensis]SDY80298.1 hypothetical protein SAMN05421684_1628 [Asanoa ishikariensis]